MNLGFSYLFQFAKELALVLVENLRIVKVKMILTLHQNIRIVS